MVIWQPITLFVLFSQITWRPWDVIPSGLRDQYHTAQTMSHYHILFEGPICRALFLSERFVRQTLGLPAPFVPMPPPSSMREAHVLSTNQVIQFIVGLEIDYFHAEGDYATFIQTHLMPPLTGVRGGEGARAPATRGRGGATRSRRRRGPEGRQETAWPVLPATMTCRG